MKFTYIFYHNLQGVKSDIQGAQDLTQPLELHYTIIVWILVWGTVPTRVKTRVKDVFLFSLLYG